MLVGVGASSAMSFRYDLWSVRHVDRDLLQGDDRFAVAPPDGVSPYQQGGEELGTLDDNEVKGRIAVPALSPLCPGGDVGRERVRGRGHQHDRRGSARRRHDHDRRPH